MSYTVQVGDVLPHFRSLTGLRAWRVSLGVGSFVTANFGSPVKDSLGSTHGEYYLWVYEGQWLLSRGTTELTNSNKSRPHMQQGIRELEGASLAAARIDASDLSLTLAFDGDLQLKVTPTGDPEAELWMLYLPDGDVVTAGPDGKLVREAGAGDKDA